MGFFVEVITKITSNSASGHLFFVVIPDLIRDPGNLEPKMPWPPAFAGVTILLIRRFL